MKIDIKIQRIRDVKMPEKAHDTDAGFDLFIPKDITNIEQYKLSGYGYLIPSGLKIEIPKGWCGVAMNKSGIAKSGYRIGACVIDSGYTGEVMLHVIASKHSPFLIPGQKLIQILFVQVPEVVITECEIDTNTQRGSCGFGSSGI